MKLGSKSDVFLQDGQTWLCSTGLPSDVTFEVGEVSFHLHKNLHKELIDLLKYELFVFSGMKEVEVLDWFPLSSRSSLLENLIQEYSKRDDKTPANHQNIVIQLHDIPGGPETFLLVAKFCYGVKIELTPSNIVPLRCAAQYLQMTENYGEKNLISETEKYLDEVLCDLDDTMRALRTCEEVITYAETICIVSRCIDSLSVKACEDMSDDWWYEDVSCLKLSFYRRFILACGLRGVGPERIGGSLVFYAKKYLPLMSRHSSQKLICSTYESAPLFQTESDQRALLEEIISLLPDKKGIIPTKILLKLLQLCTILNTTSSSRENLEKRIGSHLHEADFESLLIPNVGYSVDTLYDVDCVKRIIDYFIAEYGYLGEVGFNEDELIKDNRVLALFKMVAKLVHSYLAEVAVDANLKLSKFISISTLIPDYVRDLDDGLYRAIDIYLKAHPWLTDSERDQICRLMNSNKLSLEATTHAAQNERLPIRLISKILFIEQIRLRSSVTSWYFNENSQNQSGSVSYSKIGSSTRFDNQEEDDFNDNEIVEFVNMKDRVFELEKQCSIMKREMEKLESSKGKWNTFCKKFGNSMSFINCSGKSSKRLNNQIVECKKPSKRG